jgi:adenine-specific DNA-methyltransferase
VFHGGSGFHIVIGNPPWGAKLTPDEKKALKTAYPSIDSSTPNSFAYFIGLAFQISKRNIAYVLPDSILIKDYAKTRRLITPHLSELHWYQNIGMPEQLRPFLNVEHDVCVVLNREQPSSRVLCSTNYYDAATRDIRCRRWNADKNEMIFEAFDYAFNLMLRQEDLSILKKITRFPSIDTFLQCHEGIHTGNARDILFKEKKENKWCKPLYYGGGAGDTIANYSSRRCGWYVDYRKEIVDRVEGCYASLRDERIFNLPKIYITRTGNPFKAFLDEDCYASNNFFSLQFQKYADNSLNSLKVILPFIISPITQYFIRKFAAPRLGNTFVETKIIHLLKFCIPDLDTTTKRRIATLVDKIMDAQNDGEAVDVSPIEAEIESLVYDLYGLTKTDIGIIKGSV